MYDKNEACEVEVEVEKTEPEVGFFAKAKNKIVSGFHDVVEYVKDNPDTVMSIVVVGGSIIIYGQCIAALHTANKTAKLDYQLKAIKGLKEM